ncbi:MAG: PhnD/SsuA/transferrin family substrate-binding protein [Planctomycetales bacterium]|nr:PhnD/SsuA/transferrin family substrate-binding protein [Planctomycetales bacterium]
MVVRMILVVLSLLATLNASACAETPDKDALTLIVMDPLSAPLACDCVKGYAQRDYEALTTFLKQKLNQDVNVVFAESLTEAMEKSEGKVDLIAGKHSVVLADAKELKKSVRPVARLTDLKDSITQTGLIVVRSGDAAKSVADLKGYRILFGPADCDEKSKAAISLLKQNGIAIPDKLEVAASCSEAAVTMVELPAETKVAAVVSSYATPLLEGCGKVKKGELRIIGETEPVEFITLFAADSLSGDRLKKVRTVIDEVGLDANLLIKLETASGFQLCDEKTGAVLNVK